MTFVPAIRPISAPTDTPASPLTIYPYTVSHPQSMF